MRHGSLFSGIGGFDLAAEWMGWDNVFHCEWMEFPRKVLEYHFPNSDSLIDICKTDFKKYEGTIDIISGGFPCQPFSTAGKRKGTNDERYLWGEMLRAIQEIKPQYVIAENVFGITNIDGGLVFEQVCLDLEAQGYEVQPFIIGAASKNAPHRRYRCWFIAQNTLFSRCLHRESKQKGTEVRQFGDVGTRSADGIYLQERNATNTKCNGLEHRNKTRNVQIKKTKTRSKGSESAIDIKTNGSKSNWQMFPVESPICGRNDGLPTELDGITFSKWRAESIKGYGNAIVPQVAYEIFKAIEKL